MVATNTGTYFGQAMTKGDIYTIAGKGDNGGYGGYSGDGGPGTAAQLSNDVPNLAVDPSGNVVIADGYNSRVRVVAASTGSFYGQAMTEGDIYTIAGDGTFGYSGDGGPATSAELYMPYGLDVDASGDVFITDLDVGEYSSLARVRMIVASTGTFYGQAMTKGDIYTIAGDGTAGYSGDGGLAPQLK